MTPYMKMIALADERSEGCAKMGAPKFRRDGDVPAQGGKDRYVADVEFSFVPHGKVDAELADRIVPGALRMWLAAETARDAAEAATSSDGAAAGSKAVANVDGKATVRVFDPHVNVTVALVQTDDGAGKVIVPECSAEVLGVTFRATGRKSSLVVKLRLFNLTIDSAPGLLLGVGRDVTVAIERKQRSLFPTKARPVIGQVVVGDGFAGVLTEISDADSDAGDEVAEQTVKVDDMGLVTGESYDAITSTLHVMPPDGQTLDDVLDGYKKRAKKAKVEASWRHIVVALGASFADGKQPAPNEPLVLTDEVLREAIAIAKNDTAGLPDAGDAVAH